MYCYIELGDCLNLLGRGMWFFMGCCFFCINVMYNVKNIEWFYLKYFFYIVLCDIICYVKVVIVVIIVIWFFGVWINCF